MGRGGGQSGGQNMRKPLIFGVFLKVQIFCGGQNCKNPLFFALFTFQAGGQSGDKATGRGVSATPHPHPRRPPEGRKGIFRRGGRKFFFGVAPTFFPSRSRHHRPPVGWQRWRRRGGRVHIGTYRGISAGRHPRTLYGWPCGPGPIGGRCRHGRPAAASPRAFHGPGGPKFGLWRHSSAPALPSGAGY